MVNVLLQTPPSYWFFGVDAILEAMAAVIAFLVVWASYRVYRLTGDKTHKYFTISFFLLTLSFFARAFTDAILENLLFSVPQEYAGALFYLGYVAHIFLAIAAYIIIFALTHKLYDKRILVFLFLITAPALLLSGSYFISFYGLSAVFLAFITYAYYQNFRKVCTGTSCLVFLSFAFLTATQLIFLLEAILPPYIGNMPGLYDFAISLKHRIYVAAHAAQAAGYFTLFVALLRTLLRKK